jgi:hypothetical protein
MYIFNNCFYSINMKKNLVSAVYLGMVSIVMIGVLSCCKGGRDNGDQQSDQDVEAAVDSTIRSIAISYQMLLPGEMSSIFEKAGAAYNPDILNDPAHAEKYNTSSKSALNLGIYGVDLGYTRMFSQHQLALKYFNTIHNLAGQLGIPEEYFAHASKYFDRKITDHDSLEFISNEIYSLTHEFLKRNDRPETASLIILGGWIEALHICSEISKENKNNQAIIERMASQKYSLNTMISMMSNYRNDPEVASYIMKLKSLKKSFDKVSIMFEAGNMEMDTIRKIIQSEKYKVEVSPDVLKEITDLIENFRNEIIF